MKNKKEFFFSLFIGVGFAVGKLYLNPLLPIGQIVLLGVLVTVAVMSCVALYRFFWPQASTAASSMARPSNLWPPRLKPHSTRPLQVYGSGNHHLTDINDHLYQQIMLLTLFSNMSNQRQRLMNYHPIVLNQHWNQIPPPEVPNPLEDRLTKIKFNRDNIPDEYIDPIDCCIMPNPIIAKYNYKKSDGTKDSKDYICDKNTYDKLKGICPLSRQKFDSMKRHDELRNKIYQFVAEQEIANRTKKVTKSKRRNRLAPR